MTVLKNARYVNFEAKEECTFDSVEYFCAKYSNLLQLTPTDMDRLQEFTDYQLLEKSAIPGMIWKEAVVYNEDTEGSNKKYHRMDVVWGYLHEEFGWFTQIRTAGRSKTQFHRKGNFCYIQARGVSWGELRGLEHPPRSYSLVLSCVKIQLYTAVFSYTAIFSRKKVRDCRNEGGARAP